MPTNINNSAEDESLEMIFKKIDDVQSREEENTYLNEVLKKGDPRIQNEKAQAAVQRELNGLYKQGVFNKMNSKDIPVNAVVLPSRLAYSIKISEHWRNSIRHVTLPADKLII